MSSGTVGGLPSAGTPAVCAAGGILWHLTLLSGIAAYRVVLVLQGKARASSFPADQAHGPDWYRRLVRAHMNSVENLPLFLGTVALLELRGVRSPLVDLFSQLWLLCRMCQSITHVYSGSSRAIRFRFSFFLAQNVFLVAMLYKLVF